MTAYFDFHDFTDGRVVGPSGTLGEPIDGNMSEAKRAYTRPPVRWAGLMLPSGQAFLLAVRLGGSLQRLDQRLYFNDSSDPAHGKPSFGFTLGGVNRLDTGEQELSVNAMILDQASVADASAAASFLLQWPEVDVRPIGK
jgi:hypothetical protein